MLLNIIYQPVASTLASALISVRNAELTHSRGTRNNHANLGVFCEQADGGTHIVLDMPETPL